MAASLWRERLLHGVRRLVEVVLDVPLARDRGGWSVISVRVYPSAAAALID